MVLFIANNPMQILNAVNISLTIYKDADCDLYYKKQYMNIAEKLRNLGVFKNVFQSPIDVNKPSNKLMKGLRGIINKNIIKKELLSDPNDYSEIFLSSGANHLIDLYYAIKNINKDIVLNLYEEGLFEYCELEHKMPFAQIVFSYFVYGNYYLQNCKKMYVYYPEVIHNLFWKKIRVEQIPSIKDNADLLDILNQAWEYKTLNRPISGKIIFFDGEYYNSKMIDVQKKFIECISNIAGKDRILIKLHPKSNRDRYGKGYQYLECNYPFELIAFNENIENNIYISIISTAAINIKTICGMRSTVIMLSGLVDWSKNDKKDIFKTADRVIKRLGDMLDNFYVPNTKKELSDILKRLL